MFDFSNKTFRITLIEGEDTEVNEDTVFQFQQDGDIIWATYQGGNVRKGQLLGIVKGTSLTHHYMQVNLDGEINKGQGSSRLELNDDGKIQIVEEWQWENKSGSGRSIMTEI